MAAAPYAALRFNGDRGTAVTAAPSFPESDSSFSSSRATHTSSMCWKRFAGSLRRQRWITRSRSWGSPSTGLGSWCSTADTVETQLSPANARRPVAIS